MTFYVILTVIFVFLFIVVWKRTAKTSGMFSSFDENVQFSVYRPGTIAPERWYPMLVFAHLSEHRAGQDEPDPLEEVARQARQVLDGQPTDFKRLTQDSAGVVPREGEITFVPAAQGIEFNPTRRTFKWLEDVHREEFRLRAPMAKDGETLRGGITVFLGSILLAEIALTIHVDSSHGTSVDTSSLEPAHAHPYRRIFASYSHNDSAIVNQFEHYAQAIGDRYLRDMADLRSGEVWDERLARMIEQADVFQLFWSSNSMRSPFVKREWQHALSLDRAEFVRPTYWEVPLPESPQEGLPPDELRQLHFQRIAVAQSMGEEFEQRDPGAHKRSMRDRVGLATAIMIPFLVPIVGGGMFIISNPFINKRLMLAPYIGGGPELFGSMLDSLWLLPMFAPLFCSLIILAVLYARMISNKLWAALWRRGRRFWFFTTLTFSLLCILPFAVRIALTFGVSRQAALFLFPHLLIALSVWLSYAWIRWVFLPFLTKDRDGKHS